MRRKHNFGVKSNFSKTRIELVKLNFLGKTENLRNARSERPNYNRGKVVKIKQREIAIRNFRHLSNTRVELSYLDTENRENRDSTGQE